MTLFNAAPPLHVFLSPVLQHEFFEAITDPNINWVDPTYGVLTAWQDNNQQEISDKCTVPNSESNPSQGTILTQLQVNDPANPHVGFFGVVQHWSNVANQGLGACVYAYQTHTYSFWLGSDAQIWGQPGNQAWSNAWGKPLGINVTGNPAAVSWGPNRIDVIAKLSNGTLGHLYSNDGAGTVYNNSWGTLPGTLSTSGRIGLASYGSQQLDLFATGSVSGVFHLFHQSWGGTTGLSGWTDLGVPAGTTIASDPAAVSWGFLRYDVFVVGANNHLYQIYSINGGLSFSGWQDWGAYPSGTMSGSPSVAAWAPNRLDIFVPDTTGAHLAHRYWAPTGNGWNTWSAPAFISGQGVGVTGLGDGRLFLTIASTNTGDVWQSKWDWGTDPGWTNTGAWASQSSGGGRDISVASW